MKKVILAILLTALVCGGGAYFYIENFVKDSNEPSGDIQDDQKENDNNDDVTGKEEENQNEVVEGADFYGTYDENSLIFNYKNNDECSQKNEYCEKTTGFSISGLKDKEIETKINKNIEENFDKIPEGNYIDVRIETNFSNVLAIRIMYYPNDINKVYSNIHLIYDLTTGERLSIEDLFRDEQKMYDWLKDSLYVSVLHEKYIDSGMCESDGCALEYFLAYELEKFSISEKEREDIEKLVEEIIDGIKKDEYQIAIHSNYIIVYNNNNSYQILCTYFDDRVVYFSKYVTEDSIFEKDFGSKGLSINNPKGSNEYDIYEFDHLEDYGLVNFLGNFNLQSEQKESDYLNKIKNVVLDYIEINKKSIDKSKFTILGGTSNFTDEEEVKSNGFGIMNISLFTCEMNKKEFDADSIQTKNEIWYMLNRNGTYGEMYSITFERDYGAKCQENEYVVVVDKTGETIEINELSDMFNENFDYKKVLDSKLKVKLKERYEELSEKQIDEIIKDAKYSIVTDGIEASVESELFSNWSKDYSTEFEFDEIGLENIKFYKG